MGDMRRSALVIGCSELDLIARITYDWSEGGGGGFEKVEGGNQSDFQASRSWPGYGTTAKTAPPPTQPSRQCHGSTATAF